MRFRNYINRYNKKNRIYSMEELLAMTLNDLLDEEPSIMSQDSDIGIPSYEELRQSPNTRWIDKYTDEFGKTQGGFYGSINDFDEFKFFPKSQTNNQSFMASIKNTRQPDKDRRKIHPISMSDEVMEEEPIVLEGGVEENVYYPEEDNIPEEETYPDDGNIDIPSPTDEDKKLPRTSSVEEMDNEMLKIIQDMITGMNKKDTENEINLNNLIKNNETNDINTMQVQNVTLPNLGQNEYSEELKKLYEELLEELRRRLRAGHLSNLNNGIYTGGASQIPMNNSIKNQQLESKPNFEEIYEKMSINPIDLPKYIERKNLEIKEQETHFIKPVEGKITSDFGYRIAPVAGATTEHSGIDIGVPIGTPVKAIEDGTITAANGGMRGYGNGVFIDHGMINGKHVVSEYGHLSSFDVKIGDKIKKGQQIAKSGNTGTSSGPHLHITIREDKIPVDPKKYLGNFSN